MSCRVTVSQGVLEGKVCKSYFDQNYYSFEGIPYAKPPVGKLRFRAPQEPESWSGIRDATKPGNKCAQINPYGIQKLEGSEDCLYLNVYTPKLPPDELAKLPVLYFVHGGRLIVGYGDYYRPDFLIRHDVILVTVNYRLNILGFLCLHTPNVPGNAGVKDTIMALKWVKNNIHNFNGDPDNITVFGESAGSAIITSYIAIKMAEGLFHKIIGQSGNLLSDLYMVEEDEDSKAMNIAKIMGKSVTDPRSLEEYFTDAPVEDLIKACVTAELERPKSIINAYFLPVVEREFEGVERAYAESNHIALKHGRVVKVPVLTSICSHEGALFVPMDGDGNFMFQDDLQVFIPRYLSIKPDTPVAKKIADGLQEYYFDKQPLDQSVKAKMRYVDFVSDMYFGRETIMFFEGVSRLMETYTCVFSFNGSMNTSVMKRMGIPGASHGDLVQYVFYSSKKIKQCKKEEREIVDTLTEAWCNFAKTGKPSWKNRKVDWPLYESKTKNCLYIDKEITVAPFPHYERLKFWFDLVERVFKDRSKL